MLRIPSYALLVGHGKSHERLLALEIAVGIARGAPVLGRHGVEKARRVLYIQEESARDDLKDRLNAALAGRGLKQRSVRDRLFVVTNRRFRFDQERQIRNLECVIKGHEIEVVIFYPLREMHRFNENESESMVVLNDTIKRLRDTHDLAILVLHHTSKNPDYVHPEDPIRGSTTIWDASDGALFVRRPRIGADHMRHIIIKLRAEREAPPFELHPVFFLLAARSVPRVSVGGAYILQV